MAKLSLKQATTSKLIRFFAEKQDGTGPFTGLVFNTAGLIAAYAIEGSASAVITLVTGGVIGTWTTATLQPVDATNMPGVYELGLPNAVIASGKSVWLMLSGAANMAAIEIEIELTAVDNQSATAFITGVNSIAPVAVDGSGNALVSMAQAYPTTPTAGTVGESLNFADTTKRALVPYSGAITDASSTTTILDTSLNTVAGNKDITGDQLVFSTGANSNTEARYIIGYYFSAGSTYGNVTGLTTAGQVLVDVAYPSAPANTDTFVLLTDGNGKKLYNVLTNAVGTDNKLLLSANAQTGVTIPTVTTVAGLSALIGTPAVSLAADIAGVPTALLDLANGVETGITFRQFCRLMMAVNSGLATETAGTVTFNRKDGTTVALTVVHTSTGTRTTSTIGTL